MRRQYLPLSLLLVGCSAHHQPAVTQQTDKIIVEKSTHKMTRYAKGSILRSYHVALGRGSGHAKQAQGDHETPEGTYFIDAKNTRSRFHLALHISYPNGEDKRRALKSGVAPGGDIMIHGLEHGLGWIGSLQRYVDWTDGCIALTDNEIEEVWRFVPIEAAVDIYM